MAVRLGVEDGRPHSKWIHRLIFTRVYTDSEHVTTTCLQEVDEHPDQLLGREVHQGLGEVRLGVEDGREHDVAGGGALAGDLCRVFGGVGVGWGTERHTPLQFKHEKTHTYTRTLHWKFLMSMRSTTQPVGLGGTGSPSRSSTESPGRGLCVLFIVWE